MEQTQVLMNNFKEALLQIDRIKAAGIFEEVYLSGSDFATLEKLTVGALEEIGNGWESGGISLAQVYMSGIICEELINKYLPKFKSVNKKPERIAIATLQDHHALGKRIVTSVLKTSGYEVIDFGQGIQDDELVDLTISNNIEILLISTLMLPSALKIANVTRMLSEKGSKVKVIVGGAPFRFDSELWKQVGADFDGKNASDIVSIIENLSN